jgi:DNA polymerase-3 subunit delta
MRISAEKALQKRVIVLSGEEQFLRRQAFDDLLGAVGGDEFDRETIQGDAKDFADWLAAVSTVPFMSDRRTLIVRNLQRATHVPEDAAAKFKSLPEFALMVLVHEADATGGRDPLKQWQAAVKKGGGEVFEAAAPDRKVLEKMLRDQASALGKNFASVAATSLAEMCGGSLSRAMEELEKLALFVGSAPEITAADVKSAATPSREWNIFKLVDAIVAAQTGAALRQLRILFAGAGKPDEAANQSILPMLARQFRLLWQAVALQRHGISGAPASAADLLPDKNNLAKEKDFVRQRTLDSARRVSLESIELCLTEVAEADAKLKGQLVSMDAIETLESLVIQCCDHARLKVR